MKPLTLNKTWELCLKMWKWIVKEWKKNKRQSINGLKRQWLENNGFSDEYLWEDCFFCEYDEQHTTSFHGACDKCPARKIDKDFYCDNLEYTYCSHPAKFYKKLLELNRKRKKK